MASKKEVMVVGDYAKICASIRANSSAKKSDDSPGSLAQVLFANNTKQVLTFKYMAYIGELLETFPSEIKTGETIEWFHKSIGLLDAKATCTFTSPGGQWTLAWKVPLPGTGGSNKVYVEHSNSGEDIIDADETFAKLEESGNICEASNMIGVAGSGSQTVVGVHAYEPYQEN